MVVKYRFVTETIRNREVTDCTTPTPPHPVPRPDPTPRNREVWGVGVAILGCLLGVGVAILGCLFGHKCHTDTQNLMVVVRQNMCGVRALT